MTKNVGSIDKILRIVVGLALIAFALVGPETGYNYLGFIGVVPVVTALMSWCPAYSLIGVKTCAAPKSEA